LVFATYLGGSGVDYTAGIAVDSGFDIVVAGTTNSGNPYKGAMRLFKLRPFRWPARLCEQLDPTEEALFYSTYLPQWRDLLRASH